VLEFYRGMLAFRRSEPALRTGTTRFLDVPEPVLAYVRGQGDLAVLCLFNLSPQAVGIIVTGAGAAIGPGDGGPVRLGPNGFLFLRAGDPVAVEVTP